MLKRLLVLIFICYSIQVGFAQQDDNFRTTFERVMLEFQLEDYFLALKYVDKLESIDAANANVHYLKGFCYLNPPVINPHRAIEYLTKAASNTSTRYVIGDYREQYAPPYALMFLGDAYHLNYQFETAIATYERYKDQLDPNGIEAIKEVNRKIEASKNAIKQKQFPLNMTIKNIGKVINTNYQEYFPCLSGDESMLVFTSKRPNVSDSIQQEKVDEDIYVSFKDAQGSWQAPELISGNINTSAHDASINLSTDGKQLLIYRYDLQGGGDLYYSNIENGTWQSPVKFGSDINSEYWEGSVSISNDKQRLYFSSDRPGGFGGKDIYFCNKLPNGAWALAQNAGQMINTEEDENAPFMHPDGITLFFSSKGHPGIGGYDIFFTELEKNKWSKPQNLGYPVNSPADDIHFKPTLDRRRAMYSTFRGDGFGKQDIYEITFPDVSPTPLTVYKGIAKDDQGNIPQDLFITVTDAENGDLVGNYIPNSQTGKYIIILHPGKTYNIDYEGNVGVIFSETLEVPAGSAYQEVNRAIDLKPLSVPTEGQ